MASLDDGAGAVQMTEMLRGGSVLEVRAPGGSGGGEDTPPLMAGGTDDGSDAAPIVTPTVAPISHKSTTYRVSSALLVAVYIAVAVLIALVIWQLVERHSENHIIAWAVAAMFGTCAVAALAVLLQARHTRTLAPCAPHLRVQLASPSRSRFMTFTCTSYVCCLPLSLPLLHCVW